MSDKNIFCLNRLRSSGSYNVTKETMVKWEHGKKHFSASQLKAIKEILHTTYDELMQ